MLLQAFGVEVCLTKLALRRQQLAVACLVSLVLRPLVLLKAVGAWHQVERAATFVICHIFSEKRCAALLISLTLYSLVEANNVNMLLHEFKFADEGTADLVVRAPRW